MSILSIQKKHSNNTHKVLTEHPTSHDICSLSIICFRLFFSNLVEWMLAGKVEGQHELKKDYLPFSTAHWMDIDEYQIKDTN